ncbi:MAG: oxidoreductase FAD/NAD(P)-binding domain protein [Herbaspirillum sp.]|jgi:ferredoxin-NADP reductase|nr:oxidoreductase FAD/NAD(P)-binding domain protein [Herbaspirillum sp.]
MSMPCPTLTTLVHSMRDEADGVISVELRPVEAAPPLPSFTPGAHIDLHLPNGLMRSYSLLNPSTDGHRYVIAVLNDRNSRGGSRYIHEQLRAGMTVPISAPRNNFALREDAVRTVLLAGGIGVTPLLSMLDRLASLGKPVEFIYCARSRREAAFAEQISAVADAAEIRVSWHFDEERSGPPNLKQLLAGRPADTHLYCCGPGPMLDAFEQACEELGYANSHVERFAPAPIRANAVTPDTGYSVELSRSGVTIQVPAGGSLLDALLDAGVAHDYSCREGVCGACETKVLAGEVDHRDSILNKAERAANKTMMVCVSSCKRGPLILDM